MANDDKDDMPAKPQPVSLCDPGASYFSAALGNNTMIFGGEPSPGKSIAFNAFIVLLLGRPAGSA